MHLSDTVTIIARALHNAGCRHAFGIPGGEVLAIMDALNAAGIKFDLCKHENAGGFMAEGTFHATGAPGILLATIGPGLANGLNSVINAWQDQVPLIVISGCVDGAEAATYTHQIFDQQAVMRTFTKGSFLMPDGAVDVVIAKAIATATEDPPGPVHIDIPINLATKTQPAPRRYTTPNASPMAPAQGADLETAREMFAQATKPVIVAGLGVLHHGCAEQLAKVAERFAIPVVTSYKAKGVLAENHALALGGHGLSPKSDKHIMPLLDEADLILAVGYDPIEMRPGWRDPWAPEKCIELTHLPNRHGMHGAAKSFVGDVGAGLAALTRGIDPQRQIWANGAPDKVRSALRRLFAGRETWCAQNAFAAARRATPDDVVVTVDSGAHRILISQMWETRVPHSILQSTALCTMGIALPLAIGYKRAAPERAVMAVTGDGGMDMVLGELATLRDMRLPLAIMVMVDEQLGLIELKQRNTGLANLGVEFGATDFVAVAKAMGGEGVWINDASSLEAELPKAFERDTFTVLACVIGRQAYDGAF